MSVARPTLVIVLNGVSSVGKSSVAKALQKLAERPLLLFQGDVFLNMLPAKLWGHPDGIVIEASGKQDIQPLEIHIGPAMDRLMEGMRAAVGALARQGNDLIVDDLMLSAADQQSYFRHVLNCDLRFVGLHAPLSLLTMRERERGDRLCSWVSQNCRNQR